jgi:predicted transcriptional regulator
MYFGVPAVVRTAVSSYIHLARSIDVQAHRELNTIRGISELTEDTNVVELATELTIAWLANPNTRTSADDVPAFLLSMRDAVQNIAAPQGPQTQEVPAQEFTPAVSVRKSLASPDHIISMIDGKPYRTLRRHLTGHGLTPEQYRQRYNLKADYPMVAPTYSESRRAMAHKIGLGRKAGEKVADSVKKVAKAGRKNVAEAKKAAQEHLATAE